MAMFQNIFLYWMTSVMQNRNYIFLILVSFIGLLSACGDLEQSIKNRESIADEMKARELKFITDDQLLKWSDHKGQEITRITQKMLNRATLKLQGEDSTQQSQDFLTQEIAYLDTLIKSPVLKIEKYSFDTSKDKLSKVEQAFLVRYQNGEMNLPVQSAFLEGDSILVYTSPIILGGKPEGMWSIHFQRKNLVLQLDMKELNKVLNQ